MNPHVQSDPKPSPTPHDRYSAKHGPDPYPERETLSPGPPEHPFPEPPFPPRLEKFGAFAFDGLAGLQSCPDQVVDYHPAQHACKPDKNKCRPRGWNIPPFLEIRVRGYAKGKVEGAEQGFRARLDQRGQEDGEFAHTKPADAAAEIVS